MSLTPPPRAERVARWSLARGEQQNVLGDMHEEFVHISERSGAAAARRWYWRQALFSIVPNALRRYRNDERRQKRLRDGLQILVMGASYFALGVAGRYRYFPPSSQQNDDFPFLLFSVMSGPIGLWHVLRAVLAKSMRTRVSSAQRRATFWLVTAMTVGLTIVPLEFPTYSRTHTMTIVLAFSSLFLASLVGLNLWPRWPEDPVAPPLEFFVRKTADSDDEKNRWVTVAVPNTPLGLSGLVLSATRESNGLSSTAARVRTDAATIRRKFSSAETVRIYAAVNGVQSPAHAEMDVIDGEGRVVRSLPVDVATSGLERVIKADEKDVDEDDAPVHETPLRFGGVDVRLPLATFQPGPYRVRLTVHDGAHSSVQQDGFVVTSSDTAGTAR